jgi:hypothetical protein
LSKYTLKEKSRLITQTGTHKKVIINMDMAENLLDSVLLDNLNKVIIELNHIQETVIEGRRDKIG